MFKEAKKQQLCIIKNSTKVYVNYKQLWLQRIQFELRNSHIWIELTEEDCTFQIIYKSVY